MKQSYAEGRRISPSINPIIKAKISKANKGQPHPWAKGKTYEEIYGPNKAKELRILRSNQAKSHGLGHNQKGKTYEQIHGPIIAAQICKKLSQMRKGSISPLKGKTYEEIHGIEKAKDLRQAKTDANLGHSCSPEARENMRKAQLKLWRDKGHAQRMREARRSKPNGAEIQLLALLKNNDLDFKYVGDFQLNLGGKFPDFVHVDKPLLIELFGSPWHKLKEEQERMDHFAQFGYRTLVIWCNELKAPDILITKIRAFVESNNCT